MKAKSETRVVYRIRDLVTGGYKMHNVFGAVDSGPMEWGNAESARDAAKYLKRWRLVKVTIRCRRSTSAKTDE